LGGLKATADAYFFFNLVIAVMDMTGKILFIKNKNKNENKIKIK